MINRDLLIIYVIDNALLKEAIAIFKPAGSKKNTLVDCSVAVIARKIRASGVFSYDNFY